jgi:hypothetical protein
MWNMKEQLLKHWCTDMPVKYLSLRKGSVCSKESSSGKDKILDYRRTL